HHFRRNVGNTVAEVGKRQTLEHEVAETAVGGSGRVACQDKGIRKLLLVSRMDAQSGRAVLDARAAAGAVRAEVDDQLVVGPDPQHGIDRTLAEADGKGAVIGEADAASARRALAAEPLLSAHLLERPRPDDI